MMVLQDLLAKILSISTWLAPAHLAILQSLVLHHHRTKQVLKGEISLGKELLKEHQKTNLRQARPKPGQSLRRQHLHPGRDPQVAFVRDPKQDCLQLESAKWMS